MNEYAVDIDFSRLFELKIIAASREKAEDEAYRIAVPHIRAALNYMREEEILDNVTVEMITKLRKLRNKPER